MDIQWDKLPKAIKYVCYDFKDSLFYYKVIKGGLHVAHKDRMKWKQSGYKETDLPFIYKHVEVRPEEA